MTRGDDDWADIVGWTVPLKSEWSFHGIFTNITSHQVKTFFIYDPSVTIKAWKWVQRLRLSLHQRAEWWQPAACRPEYQWALNKTCWNGTTLWDVCHIRTAALRPSASLSLSLLYKKHINILHSCCFNPATGCQYSALKKVLRPAVWREEQRCSEVCSSWYNTLLNTFISSRRFALCAALVCVMWANTAATPTTSGPLRSSRHRNTQRCVVLMELRTSRETQIRDESSSVMILWALK